MKFFTSSCFSVTLLLSITTNKYFFFLWIQICGKYKPTPGKASRVNGAKSNWNTTRVLARLNINNVFSPFDHWSSNEAGEGKPKMLTYVFIIFSLLFWSLGNWLHKYFPGQRQRTVLFISTVRRLGNFINKDSLIYSFKNYQENNRIKKCKKKITHSFKIANLGLGQIKEIQT